jgi:tRNA(adenine34) deaminase
MRAALKEAVRGLSEGCMPIGAVLVFHGEVLASAHWRGTENGLLAHPEQQVLTEADRSVTWETRRGSTLYTTLEPCLMCMGTAMSFFVNRIVYALSAPADGATDVHRAWTPKLGHPSGGGSYAIPTIVGGVLGHESRQLIERWLGDGADGPEAAFARLTLAGS